MVVTVRVLLKQDDTYVWPPAEVGALLYLDGVLLCLGSTLPSSDNIKLDA